MYNDISPLYNILYIIKRYMNVRKHGVPLYHGFVAIIKRRKTIATCTRWKLLLCVDKCLGVSEWWRHFIAREKERKGEREKLKEVIFLNSSLNFYLTWLVTTFVCSTNGKLQKRYRGFNYFASLNQPRYLHVHIIYMFCLNQSLKGYIYFSQKKNRSDYQTCKYKNITKLYKSLPS